MKSLCSPTEWEKKQYSADRSEEGNVKAPTCFYDSLEMGVFYYSFQQFLSDLHLRSPENLLSSFYFMLLRKSQSKTTVKCALNYFVLITLIVFRNFCFRPAVQLSFLTGNIYSATIFHISSDSH